MSFPIFAGVSAIDRELVDYKVSLNLSMPFYAILLMSFPVNFRA